MTLCQNSVLCYTQSSIRTWQPKDVCSLFHLLPADGELTSKKVVRLMALCRLLIFPLCAPGVKKKSTSRKHTRRDNKDHSLHTSSCSFQDNPWTDPLIFPFSSSTPYCCLSLSRSHSLSPFGDSAGTRNHRRPYRNTAQTLSSPTSLFSAWRYPVVLFQLF